jgi:nitroreductase
MRRGDANVQDAKVLDNRAEAWLAAIERRHSRRTFDTVPATAEQIATLAGVCDALRPFEDARAVFVAEPAIDVYRGAIGNYGKVVGAPHLLAIVAGPAPVAQQHAGYVGEACILEATALGLDTCWVGGFFSRSALARIVEMRPDERAVAVSPVGHAVDRPPATERLMRRGAGASKRKPVEEIAPGFGDAWPAWARAAVESARLAPSAVNRQPWRFRMEDGDLVVSSSGPEIPAVTKALDCGIAMLHAELGARGAGVLGAWKDAGVGPDIARFSPLPKEPRP